MLGSSVLTTRKFSVTERGNRKFCNAGTSKKYRCTLYSGATSDEKIMEIRTDRVLDPGFTMHA
jgi:hypothetical protein